MQKEPRPLDEAYPKHRGVARRWISGGAGHGSPCSLRREDGCLRRCSGGPGRAAGGARLGSPDPEAPFEMFLMRRIRNYGLRTEETSAGWQAATRAHQRHGKRNPLRALSGAQSQLPSASQHWSQTDIKAENIHSIFLWTLFFLARERHRLNP